MLRVIRCAVLLLLPCSGSLAQDSYGSGTAGSGGFVPTLTCNQAWMGNAGFALDVSQGFGGATAILAVSHQPASFFAGGTQVLVSLAPADLVQLTPFTLSGPVGVPGAGSASLSAPLLFPVNPALAGTNFFAQAGIADSTAPTTFAATAGLRITLTMPPLVAMTTTTIANTSTRFFDPATMTESFAAHHAAADPSTGMAFAHGGRDLFVSRWNGSRIDRVDFSSSAPAWSVFHAAAGLCNGVAFDAAHDLVYSVVSIPSVGPSLVAIDANPLHASFGQLVAASAPYPALTWTLSSSGNLAAIVGGGCWSTSYVFILDTDPDSSTYLQTLATSPVPQQNCGLGSASATPSKVAFTQDEQFVFILTVGAWPSSYCVWLTPEAGVGRYEIASGSWTDFNPSVAGSQMISSFSQPAVAFGSTFRDFAIAPDGSSVLVLGVDNLVRLTFDPANPAAFSPTVATTAYDCYGSARGLLSPDQSSLIVAQMNAAGPLLVAAIDPSTLVAQAFVALAPGLIEAIAMR
jgi:hypothetical protein